MGRPHPHLSLGFKASEKSEHTLPEQCGHDRSIGRVCVLRIGPEDREIADFLVYLATCRCGIYADVPVMISVENYTLFVWGVRAVPQ